MFDLIRHYTKYICNETLDGLSPTNMYNFQVFCIYYINTFLN